MAAFSAAFLAFLAFLSKWTWTRKDAHLFLAFWLFWLRKKRKSREIRESALITASASLQVWLLARPSSQVSFAGIVDTDGFIPPSARRRSAGFRKSDVKLTTLPDAIRTDFKSKFIPVLLDYVGTLPAWTDPGPPEVVELFNATFPDYQLSVDDPSDDAMVLVVVKLVCYSG
jgi:hypothetical protein